MATERERLERILTGSYRVEGTLGRGGMATVYQARDLRHHRTVALKVLKSGGAETAGYERFLREIRTTAALDHPHILPVLDSGAADDLVYYVMPHVKGESLRDRLDREKQLPVDTTIQVCSQVADALSYAHGLGVVHRDVKPENILLSAGHARVTDFGIARAMSAGLIERGQTLTTPGLIIGTPLYMSPEQAAGVADVDARSDVYSLGCVVYEMLVGQPPFTGATAQTILNRHIVDPPPGIRAARPNVSQEIENVVFKALAKAPADRFGSAIEFANALRRAREARDRPARNRRRHAQLTAFGVVAGAILGTTSWAFLRGDGTTSIVVLPFAYLTADTGQQFLADGLQDALISELGQIASVHVLSRETASRFKTANQPVGTLARELDVDALVEATVQRVGDSLRIVMRLFNAVPERLVWSDVLEGEVRDSRMLIAGAASSIAVEYQIRLTEDDRARLRGREAVNPLALEWSARGRQFIRQNLLRDAQDAFRRALRNDSTYAPAWAGLAHTYNVLGFFASVIPNEVYPRAREAAQRAIQHDSSLAEGYLQLAWADAVYHWEWTAAEERFQRAITLNPGNENGHFWYAYFLHWQLRGRQAIRETKGAIELDPLSVRLRSSGAGIYRRLRRCDLALAELDSIDTLERELRIERGGYVDPEFAKGLCFLHQRRFHEAIPLLEGAVRSAGPDLLPRYKAELAHAYGVAGRKADAQRLLGEVLEVKQRQYVASYLVALAYVGLGDLDAAFAWLEQAFRDRDNWLPFIKVEPRWDPIRSDQRYVDLLRRMDFAD
jgi:serine/threonine-protein kinase